MVEKYAFVYDDLYLYLNVMANLVLPPNVTPNNSKPIPPPIKKEEPNGLSLKEKLYLFIGIALLIVIPIFGTYTFVNSSCKKEIQLYHQRSEQQIEKLKIQINNLLNPSFKELDRYESILQEKLIVYNKEKAAIENDPVYGIK